MSDPHLFGPPEGDLRTPEELAGLFSARARGPLRRGWAMAAELLAGDPRAPLRARVLGATFRGVVVRLALTPGARYAGDGLERASVVLRHVRRRDGAVNAGGFGYLRALHGARHLPGAAGLLGSDDEARLLLCEDLTDHPTLAELLLPGSGCSAPSRVGGPASGPSGAAAPRSREAARSALEDWLSALPGLVLPGGASAARDFVRGLRAADPVATGGFPSAGLLRQARDGGELTAWVRGQGSGPLLFWSGDLHPGNVVRTPGGYREVDLEGAQRSPAALVVAEVLRGFPGAPGRAAWRELLTPRQWREHAERLAAGWGVERPELEPALRVQETVLGQLRGDQPPRGGEAAG